MPPDPGPAPGSAEAAADTNGASAPEEKSWLATWFPRLSIGTIIVAAVWFGTIWVFTSTSGFLINLLIAAFVAFAMLPGVEALARRGWRRGAATGVVMVIGGLFIILFVVAMASVVIGQASDILGQLPEYVETVTNWLNENFDLEIDIDSFVADITSDRERLTDLASDALGGVLGLAGTAVGLIFQALTIALFVFYILADLPKLRRAINSRFPPTQQQYIDTIFGITIEKVGGWVYSRGILAIFSAAFHLVVFVALDLPYALAMAMWVGIVSQFVPTIGTYLAGVVPVLIALFEDPVDAVIVLIAITVYQQIENYLLSPKVTANTMELHPAVAFGSAIIGASLLGGIGALLALPVAATIVALIQTYTDHHEVVSSGQLESPEEYEARMQAKAANKASRRGRLRRMVSGRSGSDSTS